MFHASAQEIADGAEELVKVIKEFTKEKQGYIPKVVLVSPPEIGKILRTQSLHVHLMKMRLFVQGSFLFYMRELLKSMVVFSLMRQR